MAADDMPAGPAKLLALRQRLADIGIYLKGVAAVVENLNKGAADGVQVAINALQAVNEDLDSWAENASRAPAATIHSVETDAVVRARSEVDSDEFDVQG